MNLVILASGSDACPAGASWTLRLAGEPRAEEHEPPELAQAAAAAATELKSSFPSWLWRFVAGSGLRDLAVLPGGLSWWWYTPLSEKSPLRSGIIQQLYWLLLLRQLLETQPVEAIEWRGSDRALAAAAGEIAAAARVPFRFVRVGWSRPERLIAVARRGRFIVTHLLQWALVRILGIGAGVDFGSVDALLYTRFPILWQSGQWQERMFGEWPAFLERRGHTVAYAGVLTSLPVHLIRHGGMLRAITTSRRIALLDRYVSLRQLLTAHLNPSLLVRYLAWRRRSLRNVRYQGISIGDLLGRELDLNVLHAELPFNSCIAVAWRNVVAAAPAARAVFLPFEYQPMERAVTAGTKNVRDVTVVGMQTGLFTSSQMGFTFPAEEVARQDEPSGAPLPDVVAAYGELPHRVFASRLGAARVYLTGALRYSELVRRRRAAPRVQRTAAPPAPVQVLVATSAMLSEATRLLVAAIAIASDNPSLHLVFRFHYHLLLHSQVQREAAARGFDRYSVEESDFYDLLARTDFMICAGTSLGMEAIALGCMPVVFDPVVSLTTNPMLEVQDAAFIWHTEHELREAIAHCAARSSEYERRRLAWPQALAAHFANLDVDPNQRLYEHLCERGVFAAAAVA